MKPKNSTVIIPIRNEYEMGYLCTKMAIKNATCKHNYIIVLDNPSTSKEAKAGIKKLKTLAPKAESFIIHSFDGTGDNKRLGLMKLVERGIRLTKTEYFFYLHADMVPGPKWDEQLFAARKAKEKNVTVCGTRIEPAVFGADNAKHQEECGITAKEFDEEKFLKACEQHISDAVVEGFFAPHLFKTKEWPGYDMRFAPQSREETDLAMQMLTDGWELRNARGALFYHFAGRGSRRKDSPTEDSEEWQKSNYKNERNFLRKWRQQVYTNDYCAPIIKDYKETVALGLIISPRDVEYIGEWLRINEPHYDKVYITCDEASANKNIMYDAIQKYIDTELETCEIFDEAKINWKSSQLDDDFAAQRNKVVEMNECDWLIMLDADEYFQPQVAGQIRELVHNINQNENVKVVGFPRANFIDGKQTKAWPDLQWRLVKKGMKWVNTSPTPKASPGCHEMPEVVVDQEKDSVAVAKHFILIHPKTTERQEAQNNQYKEIEDENRST